MEKREMTLSSSSEEIAQPPSPVQANDRNDGISLSDLGNACLLRLTGSIDIACGRELKGALVKALELGKQVHVSTEGVSYLDVTALQLLWAARQQAERVGVGFASAGEPAAPISSVVAELGLEAAQIFA
jgi:anti-anti-sigma factor